MSEDVKSIRCEWCGMEISLSQKDKDYVVMIKSHSGELIYYHYACKEEENRQEQEGE